MQKLFTYQENSLLLLTPSHNPLQGGTESDTEQDVKAYVQAVIGTRPITKDRLNAMREATSNDNILQMVIRYTSNGWPSDLSRLPHNLLKYHAARAHLSEVNGLLLHDDRIVVPLSMLKTVLSQIHAGHYKLVKACEFCIKNKPTQRKEPLITTPLPIGAWQKIAADLFELEGKQYLVATDYYSRYIEISHLPSTSSNQVITRLKCMFARWGIPFELVTDNGPQFASVQFKWSCREECSHCKENPSTTGSTTSFVELQSHNYHHNRPEPSSTDDRTRNQNHSSCVATAEPD